MLLNGFGGYQSLGVTPAFGTAPQCTPLAPAPCPLPAWWPPWRTLSTTKTTTSNARHVNVLHASLKAAVAFYCCCCRSRCLHLILLHVSGCSCSCFLFFLFFFLYMYIFCFKPFTDQLSRQSSRRFVHRPPCPFIHPTDSISMPFSISFSLATLAL